MLQSGTRCPVLWVMLRLENNPVAKSYCTSTVRPFELLLTMYILRHHSCSTTLLMHSSPSLQLLVPAQSICNENFKPCKCSGQHRMVALAPVITLAFGRSYLSIHMPLPPWPYLEPSGLLHFFLNDILLKPWDNFCSTNTWHQARLNSCFLVKPLPFPYPSSPFLTFPFFHTTLCSTACQLTRCISPSPLLSSKHLKM